MRKIVLTPQFKRAYRRFTRRNQELVEQIDEVIGQMANDVFAQSLGAHKLRGRFQGLWACSCGYDCRILFSMEQDGLVLLDIGTHDEIY